MDEHLFTAQIVGNDHRRDTVKFKTMDRRSNVTVPYLEWIEMGSPPFVLVSVKPLPARIPCGPTEDEVVCRCGCSGYDERCHHWTKAYMFDGQVDDEHRCCRIEHRP